MYSSKCPGCSSLKVTPQFQIFNVLSRVSEPGLADSLFVASQYSKLIKSIIIVLWPGKTDKQM